MHQIELKCVAHGWPDVRIFWRKAGEELDAETYLFNNQGTARKVSAECSGDVFPAVAFLISASFALYKLTIFSDYNLVLHFPPRHTQWTRCMAVLMVLLCFLCQV